MTQTFELIGGIIIGTIAYFAFKGLLTVHTKELPVKEDDADVLYRWAAKIGKRPSIDDEEHFLETVAKLVADGYTVAYSRREAFKRVYKLTNTSHF